MTAVLLWLLVGLHLYLMFGHGQLQNRRHGPTKLAVRLQRRWLDSFFFALIIAAALASSVRSGRWDWALPLAALLALIIIQGLRQPRWLLKQSGFVLAGRYWPYEQLQQMQLGEDGVLHLTLNNGLRLPLTAVSLDELEAAAYFLGSGELPQTEQKP